MRPQVQCMFNNWEEMAWVLGHREGWHAVALDIGCKGIVRNKIASGANRVATLGLPVKYFWAVRLGPVQCIGVNTGAPPKLTG